MNLQDLKLETKYAELNYHEFEEDDTYDPEDDIQNALILLRDAGTLLGVLAHKNAKKWPDIINQYVGKQIIKLGQEIEAFLADYDLDDPSGDAA